MNRFKDSRRHPSQWSSPRSGLSPLDPGGLLKRLLSFPWMALLAIPGLLHAAEPSTRSALDWGSSYQAAAQYSRARQGHALIVVSDGRILFEDYAPGSGPNEPHLLASGTKTFWGVLAVAAAQDGLIDLDERVAEALTEWRSDPRKSRITVRQLLNFTSGLDPATERLQGRPKAGDKFRQAIGVPAVAEPGEVFAYGPSHLFAFGAFLQRKLAAAGRNPDPLIYLQGRILDPIGLKIGRWMRDAAGNPIMPSGASIAPREWIKLGQLIADHGRWQGKTLIERRYYFDQIFQGSRANPAYGLTLWLNRGAGSGQGHLLADGVNARRLARSDDGYIYRAGPPDLVMAAGKGKQRLYVIPSRSLVVLRLGETRGGDWSDAEFLSLILNRSGTTGTGPQRPGEVRDTAAELHADARNWRALCAADIERLCPEAQGDRQALRRCYRRHAPEFSPACQQAVESLRAARRGEGAADW